MTPTDVFSLANLIVLPMWLLMIVLPKWKATQFLMDYKVIPLILSLVYAVYIVIAIRISGGMDFGSLSSVMDLFTEENAVLAGWVHYLAFDLLLGMWMIKQNENLGIHPVLMAPCLLATFMLGPVGFLLFMLMRSVKIKTA